MAPVLGLGITPGVVSAVRERLRLTIEELASKTSDALGDDPLRAITPALISAWESGEERPSLAEAEALASALLIPFCELMALDPPRPPVLDFRRGPLSSNEALSYETMERLHRFELYYELARTLTRATGTAEDVGVPHAPRGVLDGDLIERIAAEMRRAIGLTNARQLQWRDEAAAFGDLREAVQSSGVFVFLMSLNVDEVRGLSKWEPAGPPAILVNLADTPAARLFTLMHEYAHLVISNPTRTFVCDPARPATRAEVLANRISGAALVPRDILLPLAAQGPAHLPYNEWPHWLRRQLKQSFQVSHPVIGIRLTQLGLAQAPGPTRSFWRTGSSRGLSRLTMSQRIRRNLGSRSMQLASEALGQGNLRVEQIARTLGTRVQHVELALQG